MFSICNWPPRRVPLLKYAAAILMRAATGGLPCKVLQKASGWLLTQLLISVIRASEINIVPTVFCHHRQATPRPPKRTRGSDFNGRRWVQAGETVNSQIRWALEGRVSVSANLHGNSPSRGKGGSSEGWKDFWKKKKKKIDKLRMSSVNCACFSILCYTFVVLFLSF